MPEVPFPREYQEGPAFGSHEWRHSHIAVSVRDRMVCACGIIMLPDFEANGWLGPDEGDPYFHGIPFPGHEDDDVWRDETPVALPVADEAAQEYERQVARAKRARRVAEAGLTENASHRKPGKDRSAEYAKRTRKRRLERAMERSRPE